MVLAAVVLAFSLSLFFEGTPGVPGVQSARADDPTAAPVRPSETVAPPPVFAPEAAEKQAATGKPRKSRGGSAAREKETDGTEAYDRFQADTVLKSKYELDGKSLEVDPD